jgi:hypothetical protein
VILSMLGARPVGLPNMMVFSPLGRVHLSGHLDQMSCHQRDLVAEAVRVYKNIRADLGLAVPFWPLGLPRWADLWIALGPVALTPKSARRRRCPPRAPASHGVQYAAQLARQTEIVGNQRGADKRTDGRTGGHALSIP